MENRTQKLEDMEPPIHFTQQMNNIFDLYFNNTNVSVAVVDLNHRVFQVNKAFETLYGWSGEEVIGEFLSTTPPGLAEQERAIHQSVITSGQPYSYETVKISKDGYEFPVSATLSPLKDHSGHILALVEVVRDISQRKVEEERFRESEERYRKLVELSPVPILVYNEFRITYVNAAAVKLLGADNQERLIGKSMLEFIHPDDIERHQAQVELLLKEKQPSELMGNKLVQLGTQQVIEVEIRAVPVEHLGSMSVQLLCQDVTQKKVMERIVRERDEEYRRMVRLLPEPIIVHQQGVICYINDVGCRLLGVASPAEIVGASVYEFIHPDSLELVNQRLKTVALADDYIPFIELRLILKNGEQLAIEASSVVLHSYLGIPVIQTVFRDITGRKLAEEMLRQSEKLSVVGQLAAGIAHEIRNPLTSLVGFSKLIKNASPNKVQEYADIMLDELSRINGIVNEFMLIAKPQDGRFEDQSINGIIANVISLVQPLAILHNVEIRMENENDFTYIIKCDEGKLKQVFINLIKNAIEAMPAGGTIDIILQQMKERRLQITLRDSGTGIAEELIPKLGDPFVTTKNEGTGLGLMVCYRIIEAHQGTLHIHSQLGKGTSIEIELEYSNAILR